MEMNSDTPTHVPLSTEELREMEQFANPYVRRLVEEVRRLETLHAWVRDHYYDAIIFALSPQEQDELTALLRALSSPGERTITADDVLAWMRGRPGASWLASIADIEQALREIRSSPGEKTGASPGEEEPC